MAYAGTEYEEVCGWSPADAVTVGDYMVTVARPGSVPSGIGSKGDFGAVKG